MNYFENFKLLRLITSEPFGGKIQNLKFIRDSVLKVNKKYGYRIKNRSYLRFCPAKSGLLDMNNEKCYFLTQEKSTIINFSAKINYIDVKRMRSRKISTFRFFKSHAWAPKSPLLMSRKKLYTIQKFAI